MRINRQILISLTLFFVLSSLTKNTCGQENRYRIWNGLKAGYIDSMGKVVIPPQFDGCLGFSEGLATVEIGRKYYLYGEIGDTMTISKYISPYEAESLMYRGGTEPAYRKGKFGFIDASGKMVIPAIYDNAGNFSDGLAAVNIGGIFTNEEVYYYLDGHHDNGKWGYINKSGDYVISPKYNTAGDFSEGLAPVDSGGLVGFINAKGEWVIKPQFNSAESFEYGMASYIGLDDSTSGYIDKNGKTYNGQSLFYYSEQCSTKQVNGLYGVFDSTGNVIVPSEYQFIGPFIEGRAVAKINNKWGFIDHSGKYYWYPQYDFIDNFSSGMAAVLKDNRHGYIDTSGDLVIPIIFGQADPFHGPLSYVTLMDTIVFWNGKKGTTPRSAYIDRSGTVVWKVKKEY